MKSFVIIVAGGVGTRMGSSTPKQFLNLGNKPILAHTITRVNKISPKSELIVVLPKSQIDYWKSICNKYNINIEHKIVEGGNTRFESVKNGLKKVTPDSLVAIHDGVRPLLNKTVFDRCMQKAQEKGAAIPTIPITDSLREINTQGSVIKDRNSFVKVQTPQCFDSNILLKAYKQPFNQSFTDDASVVETMGKKVFLVEGNKENIKITTPEDIKIATAFML